MTISDDTLASQFLEFSRNKLLNQYWPRLRTAVESLTNDQLWWRPNPASNSIGNLVLHLNGNATQWLVASFNKLEDARNRTGEFNERRRLAGKVILDQLGATMDEASENPRSPHSRRSLRHVRNSGIHRRAAWRRSIKLSSTSACTTAKSSTSRNLSHQRRSRIL